MKTYQPKPIDTQDIVLDEELNELKELLAKNVHENYVANRIKEGWTYGKERNDILKTNPTLVPYEKLTESEKDYDRTTSLETIKTILKLGYEIKKKN
ncbi:MAG: RyR domain-containing protein [Traorella sp.]